MTEREAAAWLEQRGLTLAEAELPAFAALLADMEAASAAARVPLPYDCEPAATFSLPAPAA